MSKSKDYTHSASFPAGTLDDLSALGSASTKYAFDKPDSTLLEKFASPLRQDEGTRFLSGGWRGTVNIECPEFTSLCPKTGQPDYAKIVIQYQPNAWCVESKSLKLYLNGFRNFGEFHEACVQRIADDIVKLLDPWELYVQGQFAPRGGIPFWPMVTYSNRAV